MYVRYVTTNSPDCAKSRSRLLALPHSATSYKYRLLVPNVKEILHFIKQKLLKEPPPKPLSTA